MRDQHKKQTQRRVTGVKPVRKTMSGKSGASRMGKARSWKMPEISLARALVVLTGIIICGVLYGSYIAVDSVLNVPVHQVQVTGSLVHQDKKEIATVISNHVIDGFVSTDLKALQNDLLLLPWVHRVSIHRKLPYGLTVVVDEQKPVAYWNATSLINSDGELFYPVERPSITGMPHFGGNDHKQVLDLYAEIDVRLPEYQKPVRALYVNERNMVTVLLATDTELVFSLDEHKEQLDRWVYIVKSEKTERVNEMKQADLRYSNGAAVVWKSTMALNHEAAIGGH